MDSGSLSKSLAQVLETYGRCGVHWLERQALSVEAEAALELLQAEAAAPSTVDAPSTGEEEYSSSPLRDTIASGVASRAEAPVAPSSQLTAPAALPQQWSLPVLEEAEREKRLGSLEQQVKQCRLCSEIVGFRQQTVFGVGPLKPRVCFMGEAPGADEDRQGEPFVGRAGQLLTKIIGAMKLKREEVFILNALKCRPPQNRTPVPDEITNCRPFVENQLEVLQPEYIVCLGAVAAQSLLQSKVSIGRMRGRFHEYRGAKVVVTYHPSYLLRNESAKKFVWDDMKMLMRDLGIEL